MDSPTTDRIDALGIDGFAYADLYDPLRLRALAEAFHARIAERDPELHQRFVAYAAGVEISPTDESDLLVRMAPHVGSFVSTLFGITTEAEALRDATTALLPIY